MMAGTQATTASAPPLRWLHAVYGQQSVIASHELITPRDELHVWFADVRVLANQAKHLVATLSRDERQRAGRFRFQSDRMSYCVSRGLLRALASRYLDLDPAGLEFAYGAHGKPELKQVCDSDLRFNVSHSAHIVVLAFARGRRVGVDVEQVRPLDDLDELAKRFFSPAEVRGLQLLRDPDRTRAFYDCWTRKEAFVKALGSGLAHPLDRFSVSFAPDEPARLQSVECNDSNAARWWITGFVPAPGYTGAVVMDGAPSAVRYLRAEAGLLARVPSESVPGSGQLA